LAGEALLRLSRVALGSLQVARVASLLVLVQIPFLFATAGASLVASWEPLAPASRALAAMARATVLGSSLGPSALVLGAVAIAASCAIALGERLGYDRAYPVPAQRLDRTKPSHLTIDRVEQILAAREPGAWQSWISFGYAVLLGGGLVYLGHAAPEGAQQHLPLAIRVLAMITTIMASSTAFVRAARLAARDLAARPLLLALPVSPAELLRGKAEGIRLRTLVVASPFFLAVLLPVSQAVALDILWRGAGVMIALWLCAGSAVSIGFLTRGVGASQPGVATFHLENLLLTVPLFGVVAAPHVWGAVVSLGCLALLSFEAQRAAMSRVRWIDDSESFEHETPVWRALLAFGAFQATQALSLQVVSDSRLPVPAQLAFGYGLAALVLTLLTLHGRRDLPPLRWLPRPRVALLVALVAGAASGGAALAFQALLRGLGADVPSLPRDVPGLWIVGALAVGAAPAAEELFFRGWLQPAAAHELGPARKMLAPLATAVAFAAVHPPLSFVPTLLVGLVTGGLYAWTGALGAGLVAHATHNLVVLALR
jgi:hypothetical protein